MGDMESRGGGGGGGGGALGQVSYGGVQLRGPNPYPNLGKARLRKHREISQSRAPEAVWTPKTYPILGKIS